MYMLPSGTAPRPMAATISRERNPLEASYWCAISMRPPVRRLTSRAKRASASPWMEVAGYSSAMLQVTVCAETAPTASNASAAIIAPASHA
jgi:hypothetical protein